MKCFRDQILTFDNRVPRYTSYPTAPQFQLSTDHNNYVRSLLELPSKDKISLYMHIPFCSKLCWYCGCNTKITQRYAPIDDYLNILTREIELITKQLGNDRIVSNIHFGGGSPGLLRPKDFETIMSTLHKHMNVCKNAEVAIELDPRGVTEGRVAAYAKCGVNRVSLGIQDFDATVLNAVNRQQPFALSYEAVKLLRRYGINQINVDIMYGLPHQTLKSQSETLEKLILLKPNRIAFFGYAHVPWMKKHMRLIDEDMLPQKDLRFDLFEAGQSFLIDQGYIPIGIDHFALPGDPMLEAFEKRTLKRNFQGYVVTSNDALIGLGVSSIGQVNGRYFQNFSDMPSYKNAISNGQLAVTKDCVITDEDRLRADIIEQLMCYFSVDLKEVCSAHGKDVSNFETELLRLQSYQNMGFVEIKNHTIRINPKAKLIIRMICSVFDAYIQTSENTTQPKHAKAI